MFLRTAACDVSDMTLVEIVLLSTLLLNLVTVLWILLRACQTRREVIELRKEQERRHRR